MKPGLRPHDAVAQAPIGSVVAWRKPKEPETIAIKIPSSKLGELVTVPLSNRWRIENTVKVGTDLFWAHGLDGNPLTSAEIEMRYSRMHDPGPVFVRYVDFVSRGDAK